MEPRDRAQRDQDHDFDRYVDGLAASWQALAAPQPQAVVVRERHYVASCFPDPVLNNAALLDADAVDDSLKFLASTSSFALWSHDPIVGRAIASVGLHPTEKTTPMLLHLSEPPVEQTSVGPVRVERDVDPDLVSALNATSPLLLRDVPGLRAYITSDGASALVAIQSGDDVNISWVVTIPAARRRGLASTVLTVALHYARERGVRTASLQATPQAVNVYARAGFRSLGQWQEWTR